MRALLFVALASCTAEPATDVSSAAATPNRSIRPPPPTDPRTCPGGAVGPTATWTVMVYAAGDNDLEEELLHDIDQMEVGRGTGRSLNVVVQMDERSRPGRFVYEVRSQLEGEDPGGTDRSRSLLSVDPEEPDSGDWRTLARFGHWAATCYPAERYMLVVAGHGGGFSVEPPPGEERSGTTSATHARAASARAREADEPVRMVAPDERERSEMLIGELVRAIQHVKTATRRPGDPSYEERLAIVGFDACLMQTVEVAHALRNEVSYVLASEETVPGSGWPYSTILRALSDRIDAMAREPLLLANLIVRNFGRSYGAHGGQGRQARVTYSAVRTAELTRARNRIDVIGRLLADRLDAPAGTATLRDAVHAARAEASAFGGEYADLGQFLRLLRDKLGDGNDELRSAIDELVDGLWPDLVPAHQAGEEHAGSTGLSIYFPTDPCGSFLDLDSYLRSELGQRTGWGSFLRALVTPGGANGFEWAGPGTLRESVERADGPIVIEDVPASLHFGKDFVKLSSFSQSPEIYLSGSREGEQWRIDYGYSVHPDGLRLDFMAADPPAAIEARVQLSHERASGQVTVPMIDGTGTVPVPVTIDFSFTHLERQGGCRDE